MNEELRNKTGIEKTLRALALCIASCFMLHSALGQTPVYEQGYLAPGVPQTNPVVLQAWPQPPNGNNWIQIGTNTVYVGVPITNTPNASGFWSNSIWPTLYKVSIPNLGSGAFFYANILNTTNYQSLGFYATNIVVAGNVQSAAQLIATMLGFTPAAATPSGIISALGYTPPTNTYAAISNLFGFDIGTNGGPLAYSQLPYAPPSNNYAGLLNMGNFAPATNPPNNFSFTGTLGYTNRSGTGSTLYITNGVVSTNTTP